MILIVCLDLNNGMYFNNRRQSRDREVIKDIAFITKNNNLIMTEYSHKLFENECENIVITDDFKGEYLENDFCFVETIGFEGEPNICAYNEYEMVTAEDENGVIFFTKN